MSNPSELGKPAFQADVAAHGLSLPAADAEGIYALANWLHAGIGGLSAVVGPAENHPEAPVQDDWADLPIIEAGRRLRDGSLTSLGLTKAHLQRIAQRNPTYLAFYAVTAERALADAARADAELAAGQDRGPLHGIPIGLKDLIHTAGIPTTAGSRQHEGHIPAEDAAVVRTLVEAGAVLIGKLATYEFGTVGPAFDTLYPPARNPWNLDHITGGSSSGCVSAVAGGLLRTSLGTDTGGSLRGPSSYCGVVGLKPTFGLVPKTGVFGLAPSLDHIGPISATVADAAVTLDVISNRVNQPDAASAHLGEPIAGLRIAYARNWFAKDAQAAPPVVAAMDAAVSLLSLLGAIITEVDLPPYEHFEAAAAAILHAEAFALHARALAEQPQSYGRMTFQTLAAGVSLTDAEVAEARRAGSVLRQQLDDTVFADFDALVTVCTLTTALPVAAFGKAAVWTPMRTIGFNLTGHPALALPIGLSEGLPMGMQIIGRHRDEATICQIGDTFERHAGHIDIKPPRSAG